MMHQKIRPMVVIIALVLGLAAIFGAQYVVKTYSFEKPFKEQVLSISGVKDVKIADSANGKKIYLTVSPNVDLENAYQKVTDIAQDKLRGQTTIEFDGNSSKGLQDIYKQMHYSIYQGIASGEFTQMAAQVKTIAAAGQLKDYDLRVDNNNVYLKLVKNKEVYCQVVPRQTEQVVAMNTNEGGGSQW